MQPAIDSIHKNPRLLNNAGRIGLVVNQSSVTSFFCPTVDVIEEAVQKAKNCSLNALFGPQHGYGQTEQDNMKETPDRVFTLSSGRNIPLFSLYSETREPLKKHLEDIDTLVVDLQDLGCRIYTYMLTLAACLRAAAKYKKKVLILDRVNPLGLSTTDGTGKLKRVEGNILDTKWHSFVGWYPLPMRHGLSMGELAHYFVLKDKLQLDYKVIPVDKLTRKTSLKKLKNIPWTPPSPNIPSLDSAFFFPAFVVLEGTNISEGRGSTLPFQLLGSPFVEQEKYIKFLAENKKYYLHKMQKKQSLVARPHEFRPTFNKHADTICKGVQFHALDPENINLFNLGMLSLYFFAASGKDNFQWKEPGYEYNYKDMPVNLILGNEKWYELFQEAKLNGFTEHSFSKLITLLEKAHKDSIAFDREVEKIKIY